MRSLIDKTMMTIIDPRTAAKKVTNLRLSDLIVLQAAFLVAICSTVLTYIFLQLVASQVNENTDETAILLNELLSYISSIQPIYFTANQIFQMLVFSIIITFGGKLFNGKGKFFDALLCITMVEAVLIVLKILQLILFPITPVVSFIIIIPGVLWSLWAFASVAAVVHGFSSTFLTFCGGFALCALFFVGVNLIY